MALVQPAEQPKGSSSHREMARVRPGAMQAHVPPEEPRIRHCGDQVRSELPGPELVSE